MVLCKPKKQIIRYEHNNARAEPHCGDSALVYIRI